jgi:GNAT superfamily N-acetyltransferase
MALEVRRARDGDRAIIERTLGEYLPELDPSRRYDWLYLQNPHGRALTWLAFEGGELAGITSFFARRMLVGGVEKRGALGGDGYVRPRFRRRGIGRLLHAASREDMAKEGVAVMFGTPMPANVTPLTQVGARTIGDTIRYARPLKAEALRLPKVADKILSPLLLPRSNARLEPMLENDPRVDAIWEKTKLSISIATIRDASFYTWRFLRSPSQRQRPFLIVDGEVIGVCALERVEDRLRIVDLIAPRENWPRLFGAIVSYAPDCNSVEIKLMKDDSLWRHGFVAREPKPLNLLLPPGEPLSEVLYDPGRWYFTWAESDMDYG